MHHRQNAAGVIKVFQMVIPARSQMAEIGHLGRDPVGDEDIQVDPRFAGDRRKVQHRIGRAAEGHVDGEGVFKRLLRHDVQRPDILFEQLHDPISRFFGKPIPLGIDGGNRAVPRKAHSDRLGEAVHAVGGVHPRTGAAGGTRIVFPVKQLGIVDRPKGVGTDRLEHPRKVDRLDSILFSGKHRTAGNEDRGNVDPGSGHQHSGDDLVAVGNENQCVEGMGVGHYFDRVGDQLPAHEGVLHSRVPHGDSVADPDHREGDGVSSAVADPALHRLDDPIQVDVPGNDLIGSADDSDDRHMDLGIGPAQRFHQRSVGGTLRPFGHLC